jgi:hypothetical protein
MDSSNQRKVRKNMEETNPTESSGLSESSELLFPEETQALEKAYTLDVAAGGCKNCQSTWKPTRRELIQSAVGVGLVASFASVGHAENINTPVTLYMGTMAECQFAYDQTKLAADYTASQCLLVATSWMEQAACYATHGITMAAALLAKSLCEAQVVAEAVAAAIAEAIASIPPNVLTIIVVGVVVIALIIAFPPAGTALAVIIIGVTILPEGETNA